MIRAMLMVCVACGLLGCASGGVAPSSSASSEDFVFADEYRIGVGDRLVVDVYGHEDVSSSVTVRPDGNITLPIAGDMMVGGEIPEEVAKEVAVILSKYIRSPIVTVTVADISGSDYSSRVRVTGAVASPQSIGFKNGMTVMDVVLESGGVTEFANAARTRLVRSFAIVMSSHSPIIKHRLILGFVQ